MKRNTLILNALLVAGSVSMLYSCSKKSENVDQLASMGKATISGYVTAETVDTLGAAGGQKAPEGIVVNAWIDTRDFVLNPTTGEYARRYYSAKVDANGFYSLSVDVSKNRPASVHIEPQTFAYDVIVKKMVGSTMKVTTERRVFNAIGTPTVSVINTQNEVRDLGYNN